SNNIKEFFLSKKINTSTNDEIKKIYPTLIEKKIFNPPWNKLFLRKFWLENQLVFPNVKKGQDALLNISSFKFLKKISVIPDKLYIYYIGRSGSAQTELSNEDFTYFEINQEYERELFSFWNIDYE